MSIENLTEDEKKQALQTVHLGVRFPYDGEPVGQGRARIAALGVLAELSDRGGINAELSMVDDGIKKEIVVALTNVITVAYEADLPPEITGVLIDD